MHKEIVRRISAEEKNKSTDLRLNEVKAAQDILHNSFASLSATALKENNHSFMDFAKATFEKWEAASKAELVKKQVEIKNVAEPLKESLNKVDMQVKALEISREGAYQAIHQQIQSLIDSQNKLRNETENLSRVLHSPSARGRWGEIQLRRVVELSGMLSHCDFEEQVTHDYGEKSFRPDLVVRLPGNKCVVVDAKVPLSAYLLAMESKTEEERRQYLGEYADQIKRHISLLSKKSYWQHFKPSPEFVVLFLPGEIFFSAALSSNPELIEMGVTQGVIVATPTTLIALLRAVSYGWKNEALADNALKISQLAHQLCERSQTLGKHFAKLGKYLNSSVESYNQTLGSLESRVFSTIRKINEMENHPSAKLEVLDPIEKIPRTIGAPELTCIEVER
ncbi:MAG: DNA recombination protein RmuC [bacterium]|nr:DNA recombination protein RmuC [bacterium]